MNITHYTEQITGHEYTVEVRDGLLNTTYRAYLANDRRWTREFFTLAELNTYLHTLSH